MSVELPLISIPVPFSLRTLEFSGAIYISQSGDEVILRCFNAECIQKFDNEFIQIEDFLGHFYKNHAAVSVIIKNEPISEHDVLCTPPNLKLEIEDFSMKNPDVVAGIAKISPQQNHDENSSNKIDNVSIFSKELKIVCVNDEENSELIATKLEQNNIMGNCSIEKINLSSTKDQNSFENEAQESFSCFYCNEKMDKKKSFYEHLKKIHDIPISYKNSTCLHCNEKFETEFELRHHATLHINEIGGFFNCSWCEKKFKRKLGLVSHIRMHTGEKPYKCSVCLKKFKDNPTLIIHSRIHTGVRPFKCSHCPREFALKGWLKYHLRNHKKRIPTRPKLYTCVDCNLNFRFKSNLIYHQNKFHKKKNEITPNLLDKFDDKNNYINLNKNPQKIVGNGSIEKLNIYSASEQSFFENEIQESFDCFYCNEKLHKKKDFYEHIKTIHEIPISYKNSTCLHCNEKFETEFELRHHATVHINEIGGFFNCSWCEKKFKRKLGLVSHIRMHTGEKPYKCSVCLKKFKDNPTLIIHSRIHTGVRPFKCSHCPREFALKGWLKYHLRNHKKRIPTRPKPYNCVDCNLKFRFKSNLIQHQNKFHKKENEITPHLLDKLVDENKYINLNKNLQKIASNCSVEKLNIFSKKEQNSEAWLHTREKLYTCSECSSIFRFKNNLIHHQNKFHKKENEITQLLIDKLDDENIYINLTMNPQKIASNCSIEKLNIYSAKEQNSFENLLQKSFDCFYCNEKLLNKKDFYEHLKTIHEIPISYKKSTCLHCNQKFETEFELRHHATVHINEIDGFFNCSWCEKKFKRKVGLVSHLRMHTGEKPYICSVCSKKFKDNPTLIIHSRLHTGVRPFKCSHCPREFALKGWLKYHLKKHIKRKPI